MMSSLLMLSNVVAFAMAADVAMSAKISGKEAIDMAASTQAEVEALLALQFAEPLPTVLARAQKTAKVMDIKEALETKAAKRMPPEVTALLQGRNTTQQGNMRSLVKTQKHGLQDDKIFDGAMAFINNEFMSAREGLDLKLLECGFFKLQKEKLLYECQDRLDELAMDMGLAEATIESCQGTIQEQNTIIATKTEELTGVTRECKTIREELTAAKNLVEGDLAVIDMILNVSKEECIKMGVKVSFMSVHACLGPDGTTMFKTGHSLFQEKATFKTTTSSQAFQRMLYDMYGMDQPLPGKLNLKLLDDFDDDADTDDFPEGLTSADAGSTLIQTKEDPPEAGTSDDPPVKDMRERCSGVAGKPNCRKLLDKLDQMRGEILDRLDIAVKALQKHNAECAAEIAALNMELKSARDMVVTATTEMQKATAFHNGLSIQHGEELVFKGELCDELRKKYTECYDELKAFEREMCGLLKIRQAVYNKAKNPDGKKEQLIIQDCLMSDWTVGACSSTCIDANGRPGIQIISRTMAVEWSNTTEEGRYGAWCPPDMVDRDCATEMCPIDCEMSSWSEWSTCTAPCGGGQKSKTRGVKRVDDYGGKVCEAISSTEQCNSDSCDRDCELNDWSAWGSCSRSCKAKSTFEPGMMIREKSVKEPRKGQGKCPEPYTEERYDWEHCNDYVCPANVECVADLDVVIVQDGSGSLWYPWKGKAHWDRNFELSKTFLSGLIHNSHLATLDAFENLKGGVRFGAVLYSFNPRVVTQITNDAAVLKKKVTAMKWPMGGTMTGRALLKAKELFPMAPGAGKRLQVIMLVTDGRASNRWWAHVAAYAVRTSGIKLIVVAVKGALRNQGDMCAWATKPCVENLILTPQWPMLISKLKLYLISMCPTVEVPTKGVF